MKIVFKYLKPFVLIVVVCIILLFGQAACDLSLPNLMSDIVNIGIQQGGIEESLPDAVSEKGFTLISYFMSQEDKDELYSGYKLVKPGEGEADKYNEDYPLLKTDNIYVLTETNTDKINKMSEIYSKSTLAFMEYMKSLMEQSGESVQIGNENEEVAADIDITELYQILPMLSAMPEGSFDKAISDAEGVDSMLSSQIGVTFTKMYYKELGSDLDNIQQHYIFITGLKMLAVTLLGALATILVGFFASRVAASVAKRMRRDVFAKVNSFSSAEFDKFSTASLITRTTNDIQQIQMLVMMGIRMICYAPIMGIGGIIFAVGKSVSMSWIIALAVAVLLGLILVIFAIALPKFKALQKLVDKVNLVSRENLSGLMVIRAFGNESYEEDRFEQANSELSNTQRFVQRTMSFMMPAMMLIMNCVTLVIVWVGARSIADSTLQIGDMMAFMQYTMQIIMAFLMIAMMFIMVPRASVSAVRINEVLTTELKINDKPDAKKLGDIKGIVEYNNVSFKYGNAEKNVLENISFRANPGETTAFIGSTGSGKSTLINLLPRFYDVTEGSITIDGVDIRDVEQKDLRDNIGYVPQKGVLFSGNIESNILYGKETACTDEINKAIEVAQAKDFVDSTEDGISTPISQGGTNVSGGQKQRLSIARALVKNPPIYIFDDSFSALDFKTDAALRKALKQYTGNATVLIVAQRVSTIMHAEQIIVLDNGKMVGKGTHSELLKNCETYREIAESQLSKEELA